MHFTGTTYAKTDAKGRVFFPSQFRRQLTDDEAHFVVKRDVYAACLVVYPRTVWEAEVAELRRRLNRWNPEEAMLLRRFLAEAEEAVLDAQGRLLLSRRHLDAAAIAHEVAFVGVDDRVEIWSREAADAGFIATADYAAGMQKALGAPSAPQE